MIGTGCRIQKPELAGETVYIYDLVTRRQISKS